MGRLKRQETKTVFQKKLEDYNGGDLATKLNVTRQAVHLWRAKSYMPSPDTIKKLVKDFDFKYSDFFTEVKE